MTASVALGQLVERADSLRLEAIVSLASWGGLRISEIAALRSADCDLNQRAGALRLVEAKGGKTRTIDLHNRARRALYAYLQAPGGAPDGRDRESRYVFTSQRAAWLRHSRGGRAISRRAASSTCGMASQRIPRTKNGRRSNVNEHQDPAVL